MTTKHYRMKTVPLSCTISSSYCKDRCLGLGVSFGEHVNFPAPTICAHGTTWSKEARFMSGSNNVAVHCLTC